MKVRGGDERKLVHGTSLLGIRTNDVRSFVDRLAEGCRAQRVTLGGSPSRVPSAGEKGLHGGDDEEGGNALEERDDTGAGPHIGEGDGLEYQSEGPSTPRRSTGSQGVGGRDESRPRSHSFRTWMDGADPTPRLAPEDVTTGEKEGRGSQEGTTVASSRVDPPSEEGGATQGNSRSGRPQPTRVVVTGPTETGENNEVVVKRLSPARAGRFQGSLNENPTWVRRERQPGMGWGVRAVDNIPHGTVIGTYEGRVLRGMDELTATLVANPSNRVMQIGYGRNPVYIDARGYRSIAASVNHGCNRTDRCPGNVFHVLDDRNRRLVELVTNKAVPVHDWILLDYGIEFDPLAPTRDRSLDWYRGYVCHVCHPPADDFEVDAGPGGNA